jgi:hypothetical protein
MGLTPINNDDGDAVITTEDGTTVSLRGDPREFKRMYASASRTISCLRNSQSMSIWS